MQFKIFFQILLVILLVTSCGKDSDLEDPNPPTNPPVENEEITLNSSELVLPDANPVGTLSFYASADWNVSLSETKAVPDWLKVEPMSGEAGQATLTVTAQPNENYEDRSAIITIRSGSANKTLPVYQKKKNALILSKERYELTEEETYIDVEVKSNIDFEVKILEDWITQVQTKGLTTHQLKFHIEKNELPDNREGRIVIKSKTSTLSDTVYVYQTRQNSLVLTQRDYAVSELGETIDVVLKSKVDFTVQMPDVEWIEEVQTKSLQTYKFQYRILPNETYDGREAQIIFKDNNSTLSDTVFIYQTTKDALLLSKGHYDVEVEGGNIDVEVKSNIDFEVKILEDWITQIQTKGLDTYYLKFEVQSNVENRRIGHIVFLDKNSSLTDTVYVVQSGTEGIQQDREALIALYKATNGDNWTNKTNWCSDKPLEEWYGVFIDPETGRVNSISLCNNHLTGSLPKEIGNLTEISFFDVSYNHLTGTLPDEIGNLMSLWGFNVSVNQLSGRLPQGIGNLTEVSYFDVSGNQFSGTLPEGIRNFTNIQNFRIGYNQLSGTIPEAVFITIMNADDIYIQGNIFTGPIPESVWKHPNWKIHWAEVLNQSCPDGGGFDLSNVEIPALDFTVTDLNGLTLSSSTEYSRNKYTVFYNWATWCPFSHDFTVKLIPLYKAYQSKGLEIIGYNDVSPLNYPRDDIAAVREYIAQQNIPWRNFAWDQITEPFNIIKGLPLYTPFVAVADQYGQIVFQSVTENYEDLFTFLSERLGEVEIETPELYVSSDFSADGQVKTLQHATVGNGIDLVLMGDAFVDTTMVEGGIYEQRMREGMEAFFMEEPMKSLRNRFNVHMVKVVSENGNYVDGSNTALGCYMGNGTLVGGIDSRCFEYASRVSDIDLTRSQVVVIMNVQHYAGTCYMYEDNSSVAYFPLGYDENIFDQLLNHEAVGHGFGKLLDEYSNNLGEITQFERDNYQFQKTLGWGANVDITSDPDQIRWAHFLKDSRYVNEVSIFEGAITYQTGAWRPTENSIMRYNTGGFNAPSREALYKRVMELSGEIYSWEEFVEYDAINRSVTRSLFQKQIVQPELPLHTPIIVRGSWNNAQ